MTLSCDHTAGEPNVPEWSYWFRTDDSFEEWVQSGCFLTSVYTTNLTTLGALVLLKRMHEKMHKTPADKHYT
jgi:hypothetical protein